MYRKRVAGRIIYAVAVLLITAFFTGKEAKAGDFDAAYYAARYPDVVAVYGTDPSKLFLHYLQFGRAEQRYQNAMEEQTGVITDVDLNTYIDVNLADQSMVYYQNGVPALTSAIVSGDESDGNSTPTGTYMIETKVPGKYLTGPTWHVWVDRWMSFCGRVGLHDATWRSKFGGEIYKKNGSHGCVNLPHDVALKLYDMVDKGTIVIVH